VFREWLRLLLEGSEDFRVVGEAGNGTEAIDLVASLVPELVILDIYMPELDGVQVAQYIRSYFPGVKPILVSAHSEPVYQRLARENAVLAFIPKVSLSLDAFRQTLQGEG